MSKCSTGSRVPHKQLLKLLSGCVGKTLQDGGTVVDLQVLTDLHLSLDSIMHNIYSFDLAESVHLWSAKASGIDLKSLTFGWQSFYVGQCK